MSTRLSLFSLFLFCFTSLSFADFPTVFDMRKPIQLSESAPIYRDFYINGGTESGVRTGMVIPVHRKVNVYDSYQNRSVGDLMIPVARIKIIQSQKGLSVGRFHSDFDLRAQPHLDDHFIMVGDKVIVSQAKMEKRKTSRAAPPKPKSPTPRKTASQPSLEIKAGELSLNSDENSETSSQQ